MLEEISIKKKISALMAFLFLAGAIYSFLNIVSYINDSVRSRATYTEIHKLVNDTNIIINEAEGTVEQDNVKSLRNLFQEMTELNKNYAGYIYIADTNIQYPVLQGEDNDYYLNHDILSRESSRGSIYLDYRNNPDFSDENTVIYGHNMRDQSMFNHLAKFKDEQFAKESEPILILKEDEVLKYKVFAFYKISAGEDYLTLDFQTQQAFDIYLMEIESRNILDIPTDIKFHDRILTLSTCSDTSGNYRYVVHAVLGSW